jgi:hypothetical protein
MPIIPCSQALGMRSFLFRPAAILRAAGAYDSFSIPSRFILRHRVVG